MHELGIMTGVVSSVNAAAHNAGATKVLRVRLSVGEMTEAIEDALRFAWEVLQESEPLLAEAELEINMVKPRSVCFECGAEYEHDRFHMLCPECGSFATKLIAGRELQIDSLDVDVPDEDDASADAGEPAMSDAPADAGELANGGPADSGEPAAPDAPADSAGQPIPQR